eukprot:13723100-Alexandrium_andersonii.AAC.1
MQPRPPQAARGPLAFFCDHAKVEVSEPCAPPAVPLRPVLWCAGALGAPAALENLIACCSSN